MQLLNYISEFFYSIYSIDNIAIPIRINTIQMYCFFFNFSFKKILDSIIVTTLYDATKGEIILESPFANANMYVNSPCCFKNTANQLISI